MAGLQAHLRQDRAHRLPVQPEGVGLLLGHRRWWRPRVRRLALTLTPTPTPAPTLLHPSPRPHPNQVRRLAVWAHLCQRADARGGAQCSSRSAHPHPHPSPNPSPNPHPHPPAPAPSPHPHQARRALVSALKELFILGEIRTTVEYLGELLETDEFKENTIDTAWLDGIIAAKSVSVPVDAQRPEP